MASSFGDQNIKSEQNYFFFIIPPPAKKCIADNNNGKNPNRYIDIFQACILPFLNIFLFLKNNFQEALIFFRRKISNPEKIHSFMKLHLLNFFSYQGADVLPLAYRNDLKKRIAYLKQLPRQNLDNSFFLQEYNNRIKQSQNIATAVTNMCSIPQKGQRTYLRRINVKS